jgi:hypothetical protein
MIRLASPCLDLALFYPSPSLIGQIIGCPDRHPAFRLRAIVTDRPDRISRALMEAEAAVIDVSLRPADVAVLLDRILERLGPERVLLYTERTRHALEVFTRSRGVQFVLGPMSPRLWDDVLAWMADRMDRPAWITPRSRPLGRPTLDDRRGLL